MADLPAALRRYIIAVVVTAGTALLASALFATDHVTPDNLLLSGLLVAVLTVVARFPLHVGCKTNVSVEGAVLVAVALSFGPTATLAIAAAGVGGAHLWRKSDPIESAFNIAQAALWAAAGSTILLLIGGWGDSFLGTVSSVVVAVVLMYCLNTALVAGAGALQTGEAPLRFWWDGLGLDLPEQVVMLTVGVATAVSLENSLYLALVTLALVPLVYAALRRRFPIAGSCLAKA